LNTSKNVGLNTLGKTYGNKKINSPESINRVILKKEPFLSRGSFNLIFIAFLQFTIILKEEDIWSRRYAYGLTDELKFFKVSFLY